MSEFSVKAIKEKIEQSARQRLAILEGNESLFDQAIAAFGKLNLLYCDVDSGTLDIRFAGDKHTLNAAWGALRRLGFSTESKAEAGQPHYSGYWNHDSGAALWIMFSSTKCRTIQTGTKMVEQPVYEIVCDETVLDEAAA